MKVTVISHPAFLNSQSMPLFARLLSDHFSNGQTLSPSPFFYKIPAPQVLKKWLGYLDQYIVFPFTLSAAVRKAPRDMLFVFADQALGPWVPYAVNRPHVIHCHDLMALRSALGEIPENPTKYSGRLYQRFIRRGFSRGLNFISVSEKSKRDLHRLCNLRVTESSVVYNCLNYDYHPLSLEKRLSILHNEGLKVDSRGFILHVGGGQWYKNRIGVLEAYSEYVSQASDPLPLWMVGPPCDVSMKRILEKLPTGGEVSFFERLDARILHAMYAHASLLFFPSLDEGFGWPIVEAQASGTLVLSTDADPMTEVGGNSAYYLYRRTAENSEKWRIDAAAEISRILSFDKLAREESVRAGVENAKRFAPKVVLAEYAEVYKRAIDRQI